LKFVHGRTSSDSDILAFWLALDVGPDMCETLVSLDLNWDGDHLCVHDSWERHPKVFEDVAGCLLYLLRWLSFSETRWAKVGRSGRWFIRALAAGIEPLLQICLEDENISHYNMGGFTRATVDVREFLAVASFSALSAESVLLQIFEDDRMLLHADHWWELAIDEVRYVVNLPAYVWGRIARLIGAGCVPLKLQHLAQGASFTTIAYLYWDVFRPCEQLPFSLARGDILANLDAFSRDPPRALDPVSAKIKVLLSIGFSRERIRRGLLLMREVPFTTDLVEQGHASAALFSKHHETLGEASLCSRSVCHQSRQVFGPSRTDKVRDRIAAAIARLDRRVPSRASAKNAFMKHLSTERSKDPLFAHVPAFQRQQAVVRDHHALFERLTRRDKLEFTLKARDQLRATQVRLAATRAELQADLTRHDVQVSLAHEQVGILNHMDSCRFDGADLEVMCEMMDQLRTDRVAVSALRSRKLEAPCCPSFEEQAIILHTEQEFDFAPAEIP
jgi:hypothetical protein